MLPGGHFASYYTVFSLSSYSALFLFLFSLSFTALAGPNVLLLWDDDPLVASASPPLVTDLNVNTQALVAALEAADIVVTLCDDTQGYYDGSNPDPDAFDAVIHLNGGPSSSGIMRTFGAEKLLYYVEELHGAYVGGENNAAQMAVGFGLGLTQSMEKVSLLERTRGYGPQDVTFQRSEGIEHALLEGIPDTFTVYTGRLQGSVREYETSPAVALMQDELGSDALAVRDVGTGRAVTFHHAGNTSGAPTLSNQYIQRLYVNAVYWADKKPPQVLAISRADANPTGMGSVVFTVQFSEGVKQVTPEDFSVVATGEVTYTSPILLSTLSDREYRVTVGGVEGAGSIGLNLMDRDTIVDTSISANALGDVGEGNGDFVGEVYTVDGRRPYVTTFSVTPERAQVGQTPQMTFTFNERMDLATYPSVTVTTSENGDIAASPAWGTSKVGVDGRISEGLVLFHGFDEATGTTVADSSGVGQSLDLVMEAQTSATWLAGGLSLDTAGLLSSIQAAKDLQDAVQETGAFSLEAWVRPDQVSQSNPACIWTVSADSSHCNLELFQEGDTYQMRLRTSATSAAGSTVSSSVGSAYTELQHVVCTRSATGIVQIYVDGIPGESSSIEGDFSTWNETYRLGVGNSFDGGHPWLGEIYMAAMYDHVLSPAAVLQNYRAGSEGNTGEAGDGAWLSNTEYQVSLDRALVEADEGMAKVNITGARDLQGNAMEPDATNKIVLIDEGTVQTDVLITLTDEQVEAVPGQEVSYTVTVTNAGPKPVTEVQVTAPISLSLRNARWTCASELGTCTPGPVNGDIADVVNLPVDASAVYTVTGTIDPATRGSFSLSASVLLGKGYEDLEPENNSASDTNTLQPQADLQISKNDGITSVFVEDELEYTIQVHNAGPSDVFNATLTDTFPDSLTAVQWSCEGGAGVTCTAGPVEGALSDIINLPAGTTATYTVSATVAATASDPIANTATISVPADTLDPDLANNSATDTDTVALAADLSVEMNNGGDAVVAGQPTSYTVTVKNAGPNAVIDAHIVSDFPTLLNSLSWTCTTSGGAVCDTAGTGNLDTLLSLPVSATARFSISGTLSEDAVGMLASSVTVTAPTEVTELATENNAANDADTIVPLAQLFLEPAEIEAIAEDTFTCKLYSDTGATPLGGYSCEILYNETAVQITTIEAGTDTQFSTTPTTDTSTFTTGRTPVAATQTTSTTSPAGVVHLATIQFRAAALPDTETSLTLSNATLTDTQQSAFSIRVSGATVSVKAASPEGEGEGAVEGEGEPEGASEGEGEPTPPDSGCGCAKADFSPAGIKKMLGDIFLYWLVGLSLIVWSRFTRPQG